MTKSYRAFILTVLVLSLFVLSGCISPIKSDPKFTIPSWSVPVTVPVAKTHIPISEAIQEELVIEGGSIVADSSYLAFQYDFSDISSVTTPDLPVDGSLLALDPPSWESGPLAVDSNFTANTITFALGEIFPADDYIEPTGTTFKYSDFANGQNISTPFTHARLSNSPENKITFTIQSDEPLDSLTVTLYNVGDPIPLGEANFEFTATNETSVPIYTKQVDVSLAGKVLTSELDFDVTFMAHSTKGFIDITPSISSTIEIVEMSGVSAGTQMEIPLTIPSIQPLANLAIDHIRFKSGIIRLVETMSMNPEVTTFPFDITITDVTITDGESSYSVLNGVDGSQYIDLTGVTFYPTTQLDVAINVSVNSMDYDVYTPEKIIPYVYDLNCTFEDLVIESISGNVGEIIPDQNPATPDVWDFVLDPIDLGVIELPNLTDYQDTNLGIYDLGLNLSLNNPTSFTAALNLTMRVCEDDLGTPAKDANGNNIETTFTVNIQPGTTEFNLQDQIESHAKLIEIINSLPQYISISISGSLGSANQLSYTSGETITPMLTTTIPLAFSVMPGGAFIEGVPIQLESMTAEQIDSLNQIREYIETAKVSMKYTNNSDLGMELIMTFSTSTQSVPMTIKVEPHKVNGLIELSASPELMDIFSSGAESSLKIDFKVPNDSADTITMGVGPNDSFDLVIWVDGTLYAHVPADLNNQM